MCLVLRLGGMCPRVRKEELFAKHSGGDFWVRFARGNRQTKVLNTDEMFKADHQA